MVRLPLFQGIGADSFCRLEQSAETRHFRAGQILFQRDDPAGEVLAITAGRVKIWRALENGVAMTLGVMPAGHMVGLTSVMSGLPRQSTVTALSTVAVLAWRAPVMMAEIARDPRLSANVARLMMRYARGVADRMEELAAPSVERRLARVLAGLVRQADENHAAGPIGIDMSQNDLAELARTTVPTVSRLLKRWRALGVVHGQRGRVTVLDMAGLVAIGRDAG